MEFHKAFEISENYVNLQNEVNLTYSVFSLRFDKISEFMLVVIERSTYMMEAFVKLDAQGVALIGRQINIFFIQ